MTNKKKTIPLVQPSKTNAIEDAKRLLAEAAKKDVETCQKEVNAIMEKYGCLFRMDVQLVGDKVEKRLIIIKK